MAPTKKAAKKTTKTAVVEEPEPKVSPFTIRLDSFTGPERRELQRRFDTDFEDLRRFVIERVFLPALRQAKAMALDKADENGAETETAASEPPAFGSAAEEQEPEIIKIVNGDGERIFLDEILVAMLWLTERRTNPDAAVEDYDNLEYRALTDALWGPKAPKSDASTTAKT